MATFEFYAQMETPTGWRKVPEGETDPDGIFTHLSMNNGVDAVTALIDAYETIMHKGIGWNPFVRDPVRWILKHGERVIGMITDSEKPRPVLHEDYLHAAGKALLESGMIDEDAEKYFVPFPTS